MLVLIFRKLCQICKDYTSVTRIQTDEKNNAGTTTMVKSKPPLAVQHTSATANAVSSVSSPQRVDYPKSSFVYDLNANEDDLSSYNYSVITNNTKAMATAPAFRF